MKKFILLLALLADVTFGMLAYDFESNGLYFDLSRNGDNISLVGNSLKSGKLDIPEIVTYRNRNFVVNSITENAFNGDKYSTVTVPGSIKYISANTFNNNGILNLQLGEGVISIGAYAFANNELKEVVIPNSVNRIEDCAYYNCKELQKIILGDGLKYLHWGAFGNCEKIDTIFCLSNIPPELYVTEIENYGKAVFDNMVYQFAVLKVPAASIGKYKNSAIWKNFKNIEAINSRSLSDFEKLGIEWDLLDTKTARIKPKYTTIYSNSFFSLTPSNPIERYAYYFSISRDKKGKSKIKELNNCDPLGDWEVRGYKNKYICIGAQKDKDITKRFMLYGYIKLTPDSEYEEFFTDSAIPSNDKPILLNGVTRSNKHFTIQMHKETGERSKISPLQETGGRINLISALPDSADFIVRYSDEEGKEYQIMIALSGIPPIYISNE
ncbi:MAG: leucine-rich repeat domain-containing protein [Bacteroides sp.]|nr:leucine-rich repeat domain-containing protein [Bacteroides sp.]